MGQSKIKEKWKGSGIYRLLRQEENWFRIIEGCSFLVILACIYCSIKMNIVGRTLWLDEAMLAISLNKRSFLDLCLTPLEWNQSAPVGYLYCIKLIITIFGNAEWAFRLFSILAYVALLAVFYIFVKKVLGVALPMLCTAGVANMAYLLEYSNMFKPYICDALCVLLVLLFYSLYREGKLKLWGLCLLFVVLIWFSNPVAFFSGGVVAYQAIYGMVKKDKKIFAEAVIVGIGICVSFLIMYLVWLKPTIATTNLSEFWEGYEFPLWITSQKTLKKVIKLLKLVTKGIGTARTPVVLLSVIAMICNIFKQKNPYVWSMTIALALTLVASHLGFFPMSDRLFLFSLPVLCLLAVYALGNLVEILIKPVYAKAVLALCLILFVLSGTGISKYHDGIAYRDGEEANESIAYIQQHLTAEDQIYVYYPAIPVFQYKMGYDTTSVGGYEDNVYLGHGFFSKGDGTPEDIAYISRQKGIYILFSHVVDYEPTDNLMDVLNETGTLEKIKDDYLFYYSRDSSQSKANITLEVLETETKDDTCRATLRITNEGDTYLNNGRETFVLAPTAGDGTAKATENGSDSGAVQENADTAVTINDLAPGASQEVTLEFDWQQADTVTISLRNVGKYDLATVTIQR